MSQDWFKDVLNFHKKFGCAIARRPRKARGKTQQLRVSLMNEELTELVLSMFRGDMEGVADGCADLIYVVIGTAISHGIDLGPVWNAVQAANMAKTGGAKRADGKILKPKGWLPPDIRKALRKQKSLI